MTPQLRNAILRAQRETRVAEGRQTPADVATDRQFRDLQSLKQFCGFHLAIPTAHEIEPSVEWDGTTAVARFTVDGQEFLIRKSGTEFVLLTGKEPGQELAGVGEKSGFRGGDKFLSVLGDFLGVSGSETPEP